MALNAWQKKSRGMKGRRAKGRADMCVELGCYTCRVMKKDLTDKVESEHKSRGRKSHVSVIASANTKTLRQECD